MRDVIGVPPASDVTATLTALAALARDDAPAPGLSVLDGLGLLWLALFMAVMATGTRRVRGW